MVGQRHLCFGQNGGEIRRKQELETRGRQLSRKKSVISSTTITASMNSMLSAPHPLFYRAPRFHWSGSEVSIGKSGRPGATQQQAKPKFQVE